MLLLAAMLMSINQLFGGKDDALIAKLQPEMAEVKALLQQGQAALQEHNLPEATNRFIDGYWKFREIVCQCVWGLGATEGSWSGLNQASAFSYRGWMPFTTVIKLGCWLNNSFNHQKSGWFRGGLGESCSIQSANSNRTKKRLIMCFKDPKIKCIRDCGNWLQDAYCKPVSECLLKHFKTVQQDAHLLLKILELYKCYIECDCGFRDQLYFRQYGFNAVFQAIFPWFANTIKETLTASENSDMHTVLISIFYHCNEGNGNFMDETSLPGEKIRGLGGYQINTPDILKILQDPNFMNQITDNGASQSIQLAEQIRACGNKWETFQEESRHAEEIFRIRMLTF